MFSAPVTDPRILQYAPVLAATVEIMGSGLAGMTFGQALEQAKLKCGVRELPADIESAILRSAFKVIAGGRIPGAPDA